MDEDDKKAMAIQVFAIAGTSEFEVRIVEDGHFAGTVEAVRWVERWVGASDVARAPGRVTFSTASRFMERVKALSMPETHPARLDAVGAIRAREAAKKPPLDLTGKVPPCPRAPGFDPEPVLVGQESDRTKLILGLVAKRIVETRAKHGPFHCAHEIYGVLAEEVAEFFDEVRADSGSARKLAELVDIATVALRGAIELAESMDHEPTEAEIRNA